MAWHDHFVNKSSALKQQHVKLFIDIKRGSQMLMDLNLGLMSILSQVIILEATRVEDNNLWLAKIILTIMITISYSQIEIEIREFKYQLLYLSVFIYI